MEYLREISRWSLTVGRLRSKPVEPWVEIIIDLVYVPRRGIREKFHWIQKYRCFSQQIMAKTFKTARSGCTIHGRLVDLSVRLRHCVGATNEIQTPST